MPSRAGADGWSRIQARLAGWRQALWRRLLLFGLLNVVYLVAGCADSQAEDPHEPRAKPVTTITAESATLRETARGVGTLEAIERVEVRPELPGLIREVHCAEGQYVSEGDLLFRLDDDELQRQRAARRAALKAAEADLANARWNFERIRDLYEQGEAATEEFKNARDRYQGLRAQLEQLAAEVEVIDEQIDDTRIRAPLNGRVTEHLVDTGDFVDTGDRLTSLYRSNPIELSFWLSEHYARRVQTGQAVTATSSAYPDRRLHGEVVFVSPVVDPQTREFEVKAHLPNSDGLLKPGAFASAEVTLDEHADRPVIPEECLVSERGGYVVFVVKDGTAEARSVQVGLREPGQVEIRQGLDPGETVVRTGHMQLEDGDPVRRVEGSTTTAPAPSSAPADHTATEPGVQDASP